jgi:hypothetical protein
MRRPLLDASSDFDAAFVTLRQRQAGALVIGADPFFNSRSEQLAQLAARHAVPAIYPAFKDGAGQVRKVMASPPRMGNVIPKEVVRCRMCRIVVSKSRLEFPGYDYKFYGARRGSEVQQCIESRQPAPLETPLIIRFTRVSSEVQVRTVQAVNHAYSSPQRSRLLNRCAGLGTTCRGQRREVLSESRMREIRLSGSPE